jgi:hypothetical protein
MIQQPVFDTQYFAIGMTGIAADTMGGHYSVTRNYDRHGISTARASDSARRGFQTFCQGTIGSGCSRRDSAQSLPYPALKHTALQGQGQRKNTAWIIEIIIKLANNPVYQLTIIITFPDLDIRWHQMDLAQSAIANAYAEPESATWKGNKCSIYRTLHFP